MKTVLKLVTYIDNFKNVEPKLFTIVILRRLTDKEQLRTWPVLMMITVMTLLGNNCY